MYATSPGTVGANAYLRAVFIDQIDERVGQMMRTALKRRFHPTRTNAAYQYSLQISTTESISELAVEKDASTTRANLKLFATFTLVRIADQQVLHSGSVRGVASYNNLTSHFATQAAKKNARKHAVDSIADQLKTQITVYFNGPGQKQPPLGKVRAIQ
ncbi:LPS assembly lipoprotein LptE [Magnetovibrio sp. PR-2]|uniref:LPS assembly lipoprotein LptE n=1 Tax=Magnetovibrio sp. PR-2 TaxID=3120356 RepID=UPI002FCE33EA